MTAHTRLCAHLERNSLSVCRSEKCFEQKFEENCGTQLILNTFFFLVMILLGFLDNESKESAIAMYTHRPAAYPPRSLHVLGAQTLS